MDKPYRSLGGGYKRRTTPLTSISNKVVNNKLLKKLLQFSIILLVLYYELGTFYQHVSNCKWDDSPSSTSLSSSSSSPSTSSSKIKSTTSTSTTTNKPHHVLIVADPQLIDIYSYPNRPYLIKLLTIWITDLYAKKSWWFVINFSTSSNSISPSSQLSSSLTRTATDSEDTAAVVVVKEPAHQTNSIIFLGDLLDSGILTSSSPLLHSLQVAHFHSLFPLPTISHNTTQKVPTIILPGNHDLGLHLPAPGVGTDEKDGGGGGILSQARNGRIRFEEHFGKVSGVQILGGWEFVWVDSMALLELGEEGDRARTFVSGISDRKATLPRILLTHIPLFRPEGTACGKNRESPRTIKQGAGKNYQNELDQATSEWLLRALKPLLVYSGDDHDSCIINHALILEEDKDKKEDEKKKSTTMSIKESTIKAFSMAMGVRRPGYHLLSIYPPFSPIVPATKDESEKKTEDIKIEEPIYTQTNCELPDQLGIWINIYGIYTALLFISLIILKFLKRFILPFLNRSSITNSANSTPTKRRVISAKSNGQSIHTHKKSISRSIGNFLVRNSGRVGYKFDGSSTGEGGYRIPSSLSNGGGGNNDGSGEEDEDGSDRDQDGIFPTFHSTASGSTGAGGGGGGGGMNHRNDFQLEYDEEPEMSSPYAGAGYDRNGTSSNSNSNISRNGGGGGNNNVNGNGSRRKLSRVWSKGSEWEKGELSSSSGSLTGLTRPSSNSYSNSILARIFIKPLGRQFIKVFKFFKLNVLFNAFVWIGRMLGLGLFWKIAVEVGELVMGGIMIWAAIAFWFWF